MTTTGVTVAEQVDILQAQADERYGHLLTPLAIGGSAHELRRRFARQVLGEAARLREVAAVLESHAFPAPSLDDPRMPDYHEAADRVVDAVAQSHVLALYRLARLARAVERATRDEIGEEG